MPIYSYVRFIKALCGNVIFVSLDEIIISLILALKIPNSQMAEWELKPIMLSWLLDFI